MSREYSTSHHATSTPPLTSAHRAMLEQASGIPPARIAQRGYASLSGASGTATLLRLGFSPTQAARVPGLLVPVHAPDGTQPLAQFRPDQPRTDAKGKPVKYETPLGHRLRIDCPPGCQSALRDPTVPLWVTEGVKKADALAGTGACVIDLLGVYGFRSRSADDTPIVSRDLDDIAWHGRQVRIAFDNDVMTKAAVQRALEELTRLLQQRGARVSWLDWIRLDCAADPKTGVDDYLVRHALADLEAGLVAAMRPARERPRWQPDTLRVEEMSPWH